MQYRNLIYPEAESSRVGRIIPEAPVPPLAISDKRVELLELVH